MSASQCGWPWRWLVSLSLARSTRSLARTAAGAAVVLRLPCRNAGVDTAVPPLAGRTAADIVAQMQAFKTGQKPATVMDRIAKGFTDAEVEAIAAWYAQQK